MEQYVEQKQNLKCKTSVVVFLIISLVAKLISSISYFVYYSGGELEFENILSVSGMVRIFYFLLTLAPIVLMFIYVQFFYKRCKATILVPIVFGVIAFFPISDILIDGVLYNYWNVDVYVLLDLIFIAPAFVLAMINAFNGFTKKYGVIIAFIAGMIEVTISFINLIRSIGFYVDGYYLYMITSPLYIVSMTFLYIALLTFAVKCKLSSIRARSPQKEIEKTVCFTPEQALRILKQNFESGIISQEEYELQKAEILKNL